MPADDAKALNETACLVGMWQLQQAGRVLVSLKAQLAQLGMCLEQLGR